MMHAAIENGADAVYFGLQEFNARIRAANFSTDDLPEIMAWLHTRGVRGYVTLNTLVFASELPAIARVVSACSRAGVDAVLVQDLGLARLCAEIAPDLPVHASTQMTLTSAESIRGAEALGIHLERVVTAREVSLKELRTLRRGTDKEIEVFVHGAICVAYSGQCLTSEALGGRSANRGECAQACRLPYDLFVDEEKKDLGDVRYLLSPKDLAGYEDIGELIRSGIVSLKIEGRLKSPEYVAATVQAYRKAVDEAMGAAFKIVDPTLDMDTREILEMTFSRGFTGGYLHETNHQAVVEGRFPKKRGLYLGEVLRVTQQGVEMRLVAPLKPGDGVVFDAGRPDTDEEGGRIYEIDPVRTMDTPVRRDNPGQSRSAPAPGHPSQASPDSPLHVTVRFGRGALRTDRVRPGDRVWKTSDPALDRRLGESFAGDAPHFRRPVRAAVVGRPGMPLQLTLTHAQGESVTVSDTEPAEHARSRPLTQELLRDQLGRLGGTPFVLEKLEADLKGDLMVPMSRLNALRRTAVEALLEALAARHTNRRDNSAEFKNLRHRYAHPAAPEEGDQVAPPPATSRLSVLCRNLDQVRAAVDHPDVETIYTDFEDIRLHREARALIPPGRARFIPATLRIIKPGEAPFVRKLLEAKPDAVLVRSLAAWEVLREVPNLPLIADYSLNIANDITAGLLMQNGFARLTPSYDLNIDQLCDMLAHSRPEWFEVTIHQQLPMFHMEHCVFCRFLSEGTDFTNCGRPCESHEIELCDRLGYKHPVKADAGCRNTVYNAIPQSGSAYLDRLLATGVRRYRIEFIGQSADETCKAIDAYLPAIRGRVDGRQVWKQLKAVSKLGVTRGSMDHE
jgi:putative protease